MCLNNGIIYGINIVIVSITRHIFDFKILALAKVLVTQLESIHNCSVLKEKKDKGFGTEPEPLLYETLLWKHFTVSYD